MPGALRGEGGEQGAFALVRARRRVSEQGGIEDLVFDADDAAPLGQQVAASPGAERCGGGGLVERARLRHAPVQQQGFVVFIAQADPADVAVDRVAGVVGHGFESAESEPVVDLAQLHDAVLVEAGKGVAFAARLVVATDIEAAHRFQLAFGLFRQRVQPRIQALDIVLFPNKLLVDHEHPLNRSP